MKIRTTYMCLILSFGFLVNSESVSSQADRNKRSAQIQNALKKLSKLREKPFWRNVRQAATKRSAFDTLDLDALFNDPIFLNMNSAIPDYNFDDGAIDLNSLSEKAELPPFDDLPNIPPETVKDEISNIVPGAMDPFGNYGKHNGIFDLTKPYLHEDFQAQLDQDESMLSELLELLELKEQGLLDSCLAGYRKRR